MPEDIVTAPSVNIFKGRFDVICVPTLLHWHRLRHCMRDWSTGPTAYMDRNMMMMMIYI